MDFKKFKGPQRGNQPEDSAPGERIDARPAAQHPAGLKPHSIQDTKVWKQGSAGIKQAWNNYKAMLARSFKSMPREEQEALITRFCLITTIGVAMLLYMLVANFLPLYVRVFALPLVFAGSYWLGNKLVAPVVIVRYDEYLNPGKFSP